MALTAAQQNEVTQAIDTAYNIISKANAIIAYGNYVQTTGNDASANLTSAQITSIISEYSTLKTALQTAVSQLP